MSVITVTNTNDSGAGSLRQAVADAQSGDTIDFASGIDNVALQSPLTIAQSVTIDGDYAHNNSTFAIDDNEVVISRGATVTLNRITVDAPQNNGTPATNSPGSGTAGMDGERGEDGEDDGQSGTAGTKGTPGGDALPVPADATPGRPAIENDGNLTLNQSSVIGQSTGGFGGDGDDGGSGGMGGDGGDAAGPGGGHGGDGGAGAGGGAGGSGTNGANAVGGIINTGHLTLQDSTVNGQATGGGGGGGGFGGFGGTGGDGGGGGPDGGLGGQGGNGADGGPGGHGGDGGSAVGGIQNTGTINVVGGAVLSGDSATAGAGGTGGDGGLAGDGGHGGLDGDQSAYAAPGTDGMAGSTGSPGASGSFAVDYAGTGTVNGTLTKDGRIFDLNPDLSSQPTTASVGGAGNPGSTRFTYDAHSYNGPVAPTGTVDWKVVSGANGPPASDFQGPTSGTLTFSSSDAAGDTPDDTFYVQLQGDAAAPRNESFTVELIDPSTGNVVGAASTLVQNVTNLDAPLCFVTGTLIRTTRGDVAVERLQVGDRAVTAAGGGWPITWIGHRVVGAPGRPCPAEMWPVRIRAGAFGGDLPERDLHLSPGHPVLVGSGGNEVLVPIMCLINGTSIARAPVETVTYWHVELDRHDILLANGLAAESFHDLGNRPWFAGDDAALTNPDLVPSRQAGRCRPVAMDGPIVQGERRRLDLAFEMALVGQCAWPDAREASLRF